MRVSSDELITGARAEGGRCDALRILAGGLI